MRFTLFLGLLRTKIDEEVKCVRGVWGARIDTELRCRRRRGVDGALPSLAAAWTKLESMVLGVVQYIVHLKRDAFTFLRD